MKEWPLLILFAMTVDGCLGRPQHQLPDRYGGEGSGGSFNSGGGGSGGSFNSGTKRTYSFLLNRRHVVIVDMPNFSKS